jgi:1-acyl-sn-glycerol-3-phosphate acyltransferase
VARTVQVLAWTGFWTAAWLTIAAALAASAKARRRWRRTCMQLWSRSICRILRVTVTVPDPLPAASTFLVANHLGYLDIAVLGGLLPVSFVSRADVAGWPLIGPLARWFDTVFIERTKKREIPNVNRTIEELLASGGSIVLFAEGTSSAGDRVLPFRTPLLAPPCEAGLPVHAACLSYRTGPKDPPACAAVCWWGDMPFLTHARALLSVDSIHATVRFAPTPRSHRDRKVLAALLQHDVEQMFTPSV